MRTETRDRVSIFIPSLREGGAERAMAVLSGEMTKRGCAVDLVLAQGEGPHLSEVSPAVRVIDLKAPRIRSSIFALARYMHRERPTAMLAVMNHANIVALWAKRLIGGQTRLVVSERNTLTSSTENSSSRVERLMPHLMTKFYPWADGITAVSHGVADDLANVCGIARTRIKVIYNPVARPDVHERALEQISHPWFEPGGPPVILGVGRLTPQKDFSTLIRAFARVRRERVARLLILGEGIERTALESLACNLGVHQDVSLPGFLSNPYPFMRQASVFVLSSKWEGLPAVLIEALFCGAPVVSTRCPSGPPEILDNGKYGQLVPVGDEAAMASAIASTLDKKTPGPDPQSWRPFAIDSIVDQYLSTLLPN